MMGMTDKITEILTDADLNELLSELQQLKQGDETLRSTLDELAVLCHGQKPETPEAMLALALDHDCVSRIEARLREAGRVRGKVRAELARARVDHEPSGYIQWLRSLLPDDEDIPL